MSWRCAWTGHKMVWNPKIYRSDTQTTDSSGKGKVLYTTTNHYQDGFCERCGWAVKRKVRGPN